MARFCLAFFHAAAEGAGCRAGNDFPRVVFRSVVTVGAAAERAAVGGFVRNEDADRVGPDFTSCRHVYRISKGFSW